MVGSPADLTAADDGNRTRTVGLGNGRIKPVQVVYQAALLAWSDRD
jgi:hypothetical protein